MQSPPSWASVVAHGIIGKTNDGGSPEVVPPNTHVTNGNGSTKNHSARKNNKKLSSPNNNRGNNCGNNRGNNRTNSNTKNNNHNNNNNNNHNNLVVANQQFIEEPMKKSTEQPKMLPTSPSIPIQIPTANDGILQNYQTIEGPTHLNRPVRIYQPKQQKPLIPKRSRRVRAKAQAVNLDGDPEEILKLGNSELPESVRQLQFLGPPTEFGMELELEQAKKKKVVVVETEQLSPQTDYIQPDGHVNSTIYNNSNLFQSNLSPITNSNTTDNPGNPNLDAKPQMGNLMPIYYPKNHKPYVPMQMPMAMPVPLQHSSPKPQATQPILGMNDHSFGSTTYSSNGTVSSSAETSGIGNQTDNEFYELFQSPDVTDELNLDSLNQEFDELELEIRAAIEKGVPIKCGTEDDDASEGCERFCRFSPRLLDDDYSTYSNNNKTFWSDYEQPIPYPPLAISRQVWDPLGPNRRVSDPSNSIPPPPPGFEHCEPSYNCRSLTPHTSFFGGKRSLSTRSRQLMGEQVAVVPHSDYPTPVPMNPPERDLREQQHFIAAYDTHLTCQLAELTVTNGSTGDGYYVCPVGMALLPKLMDSMDEPEVKPPTCNYSYDELLQRSKKPKHHSNGSNKYIPFHLECNEKKEEQNGGGIAAAAGGKGVAPPNPIKMPLLSIQPEGQAQEVPKVDTISDENIAYWNLLDTIKKQNVQMQLQELQKSMEAPQPPPIIHTENAFDGHNAMVSQTNRTYWQLLERINYLRQQNQQTEAMLKAQQEEMKKNQSFLLNNGSAQMQQSFTGKPIGLMAGLLQLTGHHDMMMVNGGGSVGGGHGGGHGVGVGVGGGYPIPNPGDIGRHSQITLDDKRVYNESELWNLMKWGKDQRDTQEPDQDQNDFNNNRW